jgi:hypothetical protein
MIILDGRTLAAGFTGLALSAFLGVSPQPMPKGFSSLRVSLEPESRNEFWIDANDAITLTLPANRRDLRLVFRDPKGTIWEIAAPSAETEPTSDQTLYGTKIEHPAPGRWTLTVISPNPLPDNPVASLQIAYENQVYARMSVPKSTFVSGESLLVSLELMDGINRVKNLQATVTMVKLEDPTALPKFVTFLDDGSHGDRIAKDGLYTAPLPTDVPGKFRLEAQIEGIASTGHVHRTFELTFKVVVKAARITGNINQRTLVGTPE